MTNITKEIPHKRQVDGVDVHVVQNIWNDGAVSYSVFLTDGDDIGELLSDEDFGHFPADWEIRPLLPNQNVLDMWRCTRCGNTDHFQVTATTTASLTDDGAEAGGDLEYGLESWAKCTSCDLEGTVRTFSVAAIRAEGEEMFRNYLLRYGVPEDEARAVAAEVVDRVINREPGPKSNG